MENKFKGQALNLIIVVKELLVENKTTNGIDLSGIVDVNEKQKTGEIVSVGLECPKKSDGTYTLQIGQNIVYDKYKTTKFTQDGVEYTMVDYRDCCLLY